MVVVATALVMEARSNRVSGLTATRRSRCVTAMEAPGKARAEIASFRIEKAAEKVWS